MNRRPNPFPVLDYERNDADNYRDILADHGHIEPYVDEMDYWVQLPVRVVHGCLSGVVLEVGLAEKAAVLPHEGVNAIGDLALVERVTTLLGVLGPSPELDTERDRIEGRLELFGLDLDLPL